ncbi:Sucrase/ferredoxin-like-domain-containing protein [Irpex rosettiformis]|uniref:Sucrase/ferredoxin-like-domain-containing protein n=1 Tax=Irpex rosettiformis TaxID=378272 RepID=A0ACB8TYY8_9APHY|nr:Sucrase/ferredoxin-like-domain-containing protein [Irpex rosettiformis]
MVLRGTPVRNLRTPLAVRRRHFWWTPVVQRSEQLAGTVHSHSSLILLNTRIPPLKFPSKIPSKLQRTLQLQASRWGGIVNFAWTPASGTSLPNTETTSPEWETPHDERYSATAFSSKNGTLEIPEVGPHNLDDVLVTLREHASAGPTVHSTTNSTTNSNAKVVDAKSDTIHIYVCTHGQRDCRCGETGVAVYDALREEVQRRSLQDLVQVGGVGHVGGHKYAANVLVYPYGDWLGYVTPADVPGVLDKVLNLRSSLAATPFSTTSTPPLCPQFWRGRMGLDKEQQLHLFHGTSLLVEDQVTSADLKPHSRS